MSLRLLRHVCQMFAQQNYNTIMNADYFNSAMCWIDKIGPIVQIETNG